MARVVLGSYMVRYPLGGMMSWVLQYLVGLHRLGHDVVFVEKAGYPEACYDPRRGVMTDDCGYGTLTVSRLLERFGLRRWCFVDHAGRYHGTDRASIEEIFDLADVFLDMGTHGSWLEEAGRTTTVLIDGEPGFTQMKRVLAGEGAPRYDRYYTTGLNIGTIRSDAPTAGVEWEHLPHPVVPDLFLVRALPSDAPFTTIMNWRSYEPLVYDGTTYGHKDLEFPGFLRLPGLVGVPLEVAVSGEDVPREQLREAGWRIRDAHEVTLTFDSFRSYLAESRGEFAVCKNGFVTTRSGWFSDRSAAYLASGRPVVMQDTGFGHHLPTGEGLFGVSTVDEAAAAIESIETDPEHHSRAAREIAVDHLGAERVLARFLDEIGI